MGCPNAQESRVRENNMTTQNLLVELFVEELPPKALNKLGAAFSGVLAEQLKAQGLAAADAAVTAFASPRRLAAHVTAVAAQAADKAVQQKLMPVAVGLDAAGHATPALLKKLAALGADASAVAGLKRAPDGKAEALYFESTAKGATLADLIDKYAESQANEPGKTKAATHAMFRRELGEIKLASLNAVVLRRDDQALREAEAAARAARDRASELGLRSAPVMSARLVSARSTATPVRIRAPESIASGVSPALAYCA